MAYFGISWQTARAEPKRGAIVASRSEETEQSALITTDLLIAMPADKERSGRAPAAEPDPCDYSLERSELRFPVGLDKAHTQHITVHNRAATAGLAYKIKTTNPRRYSVRPNAGYLAGGARATVTVQLPAHKVQPNEVGKCKDKFQACPLRTAAMPTTRPAR